MSWNTVFSNYFLAVRIYKKGQQAGFDMQAILCQLLLYSLDSATPWLGDLVLVNIIKPLIPSFK